MKMTMTLLLLTGKAQIVALVLASALCNSLRPQAPATALYIELQNVVEYQVDTTDLSRW